MKRYAGIEAGGTKCIVAISEGDDAQNIIEKTEIPTTTPDETLTKIVQCLKQRTGFVSIGIACFGPIDLNKSSDTYGYITTTPKPGWANVDFVGAIKKEFPHVPINFDTDVNGAVLAEAKYSKINDIAYVTVGTGVGVGIAVNKVPIHGMLHPEMGHILVRKDENDNFKGTCPFHGDCLEGLVSAPNLANRFNLPASDLPKISDDEKVWDYVAYYLAQLSLCLTFTCSTERIVFGGGIIKRPMLLPKMRANLLKLNNGYIKTRHLDDIDNYLVESNFGQDAGVIGSIVLAQTVYKE